MTIRLNLKKTSGKYTIVRAIVRIEGKKYTVSTGVKVEIRDWDKKREQCKIDTAANEQIKEAIAKIKKTIEKTGLPPTNLKKPIQKETTITQAIRQHRRRREIESTSPHSWRAYSTLESNITRYTKACNRKERYVSDISPKFIEGFQKWMIESDYTNGHIAKMVKTLRTVIRKLVPETVWNTTKPPSSIPTDQIYLTPDEIHAIEILKIPSTKTLNQTRDLFLIGCYTGLRFSDWNQVGRSRIQTVNGVEILTISQTKTKNPTTLPVTGKLKAIIDRYPEGIPKITSQAINRGIKKLGRLAGLIQTITITEYRGGRPNQLQFQKWELMSTHTARRSFATNAMLAGIPITEVMKFTGHKSLAAFLQYIRTTNQDAAIKYANHPFFQ